MPSNNLSSNLQTKTVRKFLPEFDSEVVSLKTVSYSPIQNEHNASTGDTVYIKRPHKYAAVNTATGDISGETPNKIQSGRAAATVQDYSTIWIDWESIEEANELDQWDQIIAPAASELAVDVETRLNTFMKNNGSHQLGTAGTAITKWSDIAQLNTYSQALGFPAGQITAQVGPGAVENLADSIKGIYSSKDAMTAWERAQIPSMNANIKLLQSSLLAAHTPGAHDGGLQLNAAPVQTYVSGKDTFQTTIVLKGCDADTTDFLKAGDKVQIDSKYFANLKSRNQAYDATGGGYSYTGTVAADVSSVGTLCTVVLNGPAFYESGGQYNTISAALAEDDNVSIISGTAGEAYVPNMFYHPSAFSVSSLAQKKLRGWDAIMKSKYGLQMRFTEFSDGASNVNYLRIDTIPIFGAMNPLLAGTFYGQ